MELYFDSSYTSERHGALVFIVVGMKLKLSKYARSFRTASEAFIYTPFSFGSVEMR